jgi:hypothetical protein
MKNRFYYATHQISPCKFRAIKCNVFLMLLLSVYTIHIHILMMPRRKLTLEQKWQVIGMRNTGLSLHRIADQFGVSVLYSGFWSAIEKQGPLKNVTILVSHIKHHPEITEHYRNQLVVVHFRLHVDYVTTGRFMAVWVYELLAADSIAHT